MPQIEPTAITRPRPSNLIPGYRLDKLVGAGGMGEVHKATQLSLGRTVAVKLLSYDLAKDASFVARFQKEAAALATLSHPHIVAIVDTGKTDTTYYLVMEFVDGPSLRELMRSPLLDPTSALRMMLEICRAVDYAHNRGVIHRDLKPENILFDEQAGNIPKVTDFGLASFLDDSSARFNVTATHMSMGTLSYMAPEQRVDAKSADSRADVFSLGVILYEMLVGEVPLGTFDPPSRKKPGVDARLDAIVTRCLKPDPADRYARVADLMEDLEPLVPGHSSTMRPQRLSRVQRVKQQVKHVLRRAGQVTATLLILAAVGVLGLAALRNGERRAEVIPGATLTADLGPPSVRTLSGRVERAISSTKIQLSQGPDPVSLVVAGRPLSIEPEALRFGPVDGQSRVGRARVDVVNLEGQAVTLSATVQAERPLATAWTRIRHFLLGAPPASKAGLLLLGTPGRYVALVVEADGSPIALEWSLGERRGTMLGPTAPTGAVALELSINQEGLTQAFVGAGRDRRPLGEPLHLGTEWQKHFGEAPAPGFGCIEGSCQARALVYAVERDLVPPVTEVSETELPESPTMNGKAGAVPTKGALLKKGGMPSRRSAVKSAATTRGTRKR